MARTCKSCGTELPARAGRGRPAIYCGRRCRRSVEITVRRLRRRVTALDHVIAQRREFGPEWGGDLGELEAERRVVRARLTTLTDHQ